MLGLLRERERRVVRGEKGRSGGVGKGGWSKGRGVGARGCSGSRAIFLNGIATPGA